MMRFAMLSASDGLTLKLHAKGGMRCAFPPYGAL